MSLSMAPVVIDDVLNNILEFCDSKTHINFKQSSRKFYELYWNSSCVKTMVFNNLISYKAYKEWRKLNNRMNITHYKFLEEFQGQLGNIKDPINTLSISNGDIHQIHNSVATNIKKLIVHRSDKKLLKDVYNRCIPKTLLKINPETIEIFDLKFKTAFFYHSNIHIYYPSLKNIIVRSCGFNIISYPFVNNSIKQLQNLKTFIYELTIYNHTLNKFLSQLPDSVEYIKVSIINTVLNYDTIIELDKYPKSLKRLDIVFWREERSIFGFVSVPSINFKHKPTYNGEIIKINF